ncbi:hypothetical protein ILUMI_16796 [Ignelater luminosus]|uniref:Uncharacterized protein n=1 Tax=Ignelater luminosus TaxID=2038154 RepID=A0A8K0G5M1_IGNLU|nr:hypothetical protein ILUMI_16796 [Ignelater luminosus]
MEQLFRNDDPTSKFETLLRPRKRLDMIQLQDLSLKHTIKQETKKFGKTINSTKENENIADGDCNSDKYSDNELCECEEPEDVNII